MATDPRDTLDVNRQSARALVARAGKQRTREVLKRAEKDLARRLAEAVKGPGVGSFTYEQIRMSLQQVRIVLKTVQAGIKDAAVDGAREAAEIAADGTLRYMRDADKAFRGIGAQPLALDEAAVMDAAVSGAQASVLRRLASSGEPVLGADEHPHPAKVGILERYGVETVGRFEAVLQTGLIAKKPWSEMRADITAESPFLQGAPAFWAERIVRTETMGAYNRAGWEANREADEQLGDIVKILAATFDDRTSADSYAVHGQIRLPDEAFASWFGLYQHPPNRPNDREIVVPHRRAWVLPPYLKWKTDAQIAARWRQEGRKMAVPPRPLMTTVDVLGFGRGG